MLNGKEIGYLALVLHAHLPYVRHIEEDCLEERWLFEAITETYVPLLQTFEDLVQEGVDYRVTLSLSPTLLTMLSDSLLLSRYEKHLEKLIELSMREVARTRRDEQINSLSVMYLKTFAGIKEYMERHHYLLIPQFKKLADKGVLELITTSATHGFMPSMETEESVFSQWETGLAVFQQHLGYRPKGVWLPECGYTPGLDRILQQLGVQYFFCDSHAVEHAAPKANRGVYAPIMTGYGVHAFARDPESSSQVWSSFEGYPGDYDYREYYRDIGFDLPMSYIKPYIHPKGIRVNTGIKYYRITGKENHKEPYVPGWAEEKAAMHAGNFMFNREHQAIHLRGQMDRKPIIVAPYDAELFGHWWYEGPQFIKHLCRKLYYDQNHVRMITPSEYLESHPYSDSAHLPESSWGRNGYGEVWINPKNAWIYRHLHKAEKRMIELAERFPSPSDLEERALNQAARQLLLAQSSDWPFIIDNQSMVEYAKQRLQDHLAAFHLLYEELQGQRVDEEWLEELEAEWPIFEQINYRVYLPAQEHMLAIASGLETGVTSSGRRILMLSWEYPPKIVGGLSRAVYDLSRSLAQQGEEIHVLTSHVDGYPNFEYAEGVYVHRLSCLKESDRVDFIDWVLQFNVEMVRYVEKCLGIGVRFDCIHAHDWLVSPAARELKKKFQLPLVATIHATEFGRNQGIYSDLQHKIHHQEWQLTYEAEKVIVCSKYMENEVIRLFELPREKVLAIPNGVDVRKLELGAETYFRRDDYALPNEKIIFFVGRLVREKGAQYLIEVAPEILAACPEAKFVISGRGPMMDELKRMAAERGVDHKFLFTGFIDDEQRNGLLHHANLAVFPSIYEPFGIVALEAMAAGTPVLVSDTGGLSEIVEHGENGLKIYPGIAASLKDQLLYALTHEQQMKAMAESARETLIRTYHWADIASVTRKVYDSLRRDLIIS
ncbi:1,4-alpha-glucan branching protein domain-containing protein [Ammoniphilus sp. 3BR4]|uniref:1,4-alpha-glucan branching protein domain-containing protein n=1 Tax=Ammoniphilus sp. 3BR4 TaxID=3158265 RepID=UPI0034671E91